MPTTNGIVYFDGTKIETADGTNPALVRTPILGFINASNAASGVIGEIILSNVPIGAPIPLTTNVITDITNITLSAGDWDIRSVIGFTANSLGAITGTSSFSFIGTAAGNNTTGLIPSQNATSTTLVPSAAVDIILTLPVYRINVSSSTTYYLKAQSIFAVGNVFAYGNIEGRRIR